MKGRLASRYLKSLALGRGDTLSALGYTDGSRWDDGSKARIKAAVEAMSTTSTGLARDVGIDFYSLVYPQTIVGRLEHLRHVPFGVTLVGQSRGATANWVAEGAPAPISDSTFFKMPALEPRKIVAVSVVTEEMISQSKGEEFIVDGLKAAVVSGMNKAFISVANVGVDGEKPASVTYDAVKVPATTDPKQDFFDAVTKLAGADLTKTAWIMHPARAVVLAFLGGAFENVGALGGEILGIPVITSSSVDFGSIVLIDASGVHFGSDGAAELKASTKGSVLMQDNISSSAAAELTSLWQANSVGLMASISANWRVARENSVVVIEGTGGEQEFKQSNINLGV